jgi:YVTN family beta-propeller protein
VAVGDAAVPILILVAEFSIGAIFAGYRIEGLAAQGGMGRVYRATQMALNRQVALKLIVPEVAHDPAYRARFERESLLSASIDHPNVIPIYEAGEAEGHLFIAMRWVNGTDLRSVIRSEGRLDPPRVVAIAEQVAAALDAAHSAGLVHRDVKPANVMLTATHGGEHVYLTDFGLTKKTKSNTALTRAGDFVGTPDYMPPEQVKGGEADARADVYGLGCLIYNALTGRAPYERETELAKMWAHLYDQPPRVLDAAPGTPVGFDEVITRALAKNAGERYPSAGDLARATRAALNGALPLQRERSLATGLAAPQPPGTSPTPPAQSSIPTAPGAAAATPGSSPSEPTSHSIAPAPSAAPAAPPSSPRRERPRRRAAAMAVAAVLALGAVGAVLAVAGVFSGRGGDTANSAGDGDPNERATPKVVANIPAGDGPDGIDVDGRAVWVSNSRGNTLTRLDAKRNEATDRVEVGSNPDEVEAAHGVVWVSNTDDGTVTRVVADPQPGEPTAIPVGAGPEGLSLGDQSLWVANGDSDSVSRIDRESATLEPDIAVEDKPIGIFEGEKWVWVTNSFSRSVTRIDPSSGGIAGTTRNVGENIRSVIEGFGFTWVSSAVPDGTVTRLDSETGEKVGDPIPVQNRPKEMALAGGYLWVVNEGSGSVSRIDPKARRVVGSPIPVGKKPVGIAAGAGALWVTNNASDTVTRIDL